MTLLLQRFHSFEHTIDSYIIKIIKKNTIGSYLFIFMAIPLSILCMLGCIGILALPLAYLFA